MKIPFIIAIVLLGLAAAIFFSNQDAMERCLAEHGLETCVTNLK